MKKAIIRISSAFIMALMICTGCERFLTVPTESSYDSTNVFQTVTQAEMAVYGAYVVLAHPMYGRKVVTMTTADTDVLRQQGGWDQVGRKNFARYSSTPASVDTELNNLWNKWYSCIERANICIDRVPKMDLYTNGTEGEIAALKRVHGEALCIRALCYLDLIVRWGDVPAQFEPSKAGDDFYVDRTSRDVIYAQLVSDLKEAVELLPWRREVQAAARFTKGAAYGLLARVSLHAAGYSLRWNLEDGSNLGMRTIDNQEVIRSYYETARDACWAVINDPMANHRLNPVYKNIWKTLCSCKFDTEYGESMFEIGMFNPVLENTANGQIGSKIGMTIKEGSSYGKASSEVRLTAPYVASFKPNDTRYDSVVADYEIAKNNTTIITNKMWEYNPGKWRLYWNPTFVTDYTNINWIYLRYADVLLMFAEAENWLNNGPTQRAIDALKEVRKRAYYGNEDEIDAESYGSMDANEFLDVIVQERAWELGAEALRKYDLIRWNKLASALAATKQAHKDMPGNTDKYPKYVYYLTGTDPDVRPEVIYSNKKNDANLLDQGYIMTNYTNGLASDANVQTVFAQDFQVNKTELYPIPQSICDDNPNLSQHPSYRSAE